MFLALTTAAMVQAGALVPGPLAQTPSLPDARFALALYCNPTCSEEVMTGLDKDLMEIKSRAGFPEKTTRPGRIMGVAGPEFGIPDADFVEAFGVDVDRADALAKSEQVLLAWFSAPRDQADIVLGIAHKAFLNAAKTSGGWVEDLDTQRVYGTAAWEALDPKGPIDGWFVIDAGPQDPADEDGPLRLVTRGLRRFGTLELVVENVDPGMAGDISYVMNAVALALRPLDAVPASLPIADESVKGSATFTETTPREEDPAAPLAILNFDGEITLPPEVIDTPAASLPAEASLVPMPSVPAAPAEPAGPPTTLEAAQGQALNRLNTEVRAAFTTGLPPGAAVAVNVPYTSPTGAREYLWVELRGWEGTKMTGVLVNQPSLVKGMKQGDVVQVDQNQVFDYIWKKGDGTKEGNTTAAFVRR